MLEILNQGESLLKDKEEFDVYAFLNYGSLGDAPI